MNPRWTRLATVFRRREKREVTPEMARLRARAAHLRGEIFYLRPAYTQRLRWELAGLERRMQEMEAAARAALRSAGQAPASSAERQTTMEEDEMSEIKSRFRTIDGLSVRYAESDGAHDREALLLSPWPESLYAAWVGFDALLFAALAAMAVLGWRQRRAVVHAATATAVLLVCDAWFDVSLDLGTEDVWLSGALALFVELPLAVYLFKQATRYAQRFAQAQQGPRTRRTQTAKEEPCRGLASRPTAG